MSNTVTIYFQKCNGFGWHWMLYRGAGTLPMSSSEAFANAREAEKVAKSVAKCNEGRYEGLRDEASLQQLFRENPRYGVVIAEEPHTSAAQWQAYDRHGSYA